MTTATASRGNQIGVPPALRTAQEPNYFPKVQQMLGKFSPHRHSVSSCRMYITDLIFINLPARFMASPEYRA